MLRYLVWRFRFELCNIRRLFGHGNERVHYLGFGANLSDRIMRERRIKPLAARPFSVRDYGLRFDHPSPWVGCGYASAEPAPGEVVHGMLYTLSGRDAARMDFYEGVPVLNRYRRTLVEQDGVSLYFYQTNRSTPGLGPTPEYLGFIVDGLREHPNVSDEYFRGLEATETIEPDTMVWCYLWQQPRDRAPWLRYSIGLYQLIVLKVFFNYLYRLSLTAPFIRH